jgi:integrase
MAPIDAWRALYCSFDFFAAAWVTSRLLAARSSLKSAKAFSDFAVAASAEERRRVCQPQAITASSRRAPSTDASGFLRRKAGMSARPSRRHRPRPKGKRQLNHRRHMASLRALFALVTVVHERGYRISEWLRWRWETVALQEARASILLSKPDRWVPFDLSPVAVAALGQMPALETGRVFPWLSRAQVYKAVDRFGIRWRPHESRRSVVTAVRQATGSIKAAQEYVSHASINTTLRYERPDVVTPSVRAGGKRARSGEPGK